MQVDSLISISKLPYSKSWWMTRSEQETKSWMKGGKSKSVGCSENGVCKVMYVFLCDKKVGSVRREGGGF